MWIYKITNDINNKVYIGQTSRDVKKRFQRHIQDAVSNRLDTYFARAIRKYGKEHFSYETIDTVNSQIELNQKKHDWINYFDSVNNGYNERDFILKCGGNTYYSYW